MQSKSSRSGQLSSAAVAFLLAGLAGCDGSRAPTGPRPDAPRSAGAVLKFGCDDPTVARELGRRAAGWAGRAGATVTVVPAAEADVRLVPPAAVGGLAAAGAVRPLPAEVAAVTHPLQLSRVLPALRDRLTGWGAGQYGLTVAGDGYALVYRADRFADPAARAAHEQRTGRPLAPPASWEDILEAAETFAPGGPPLAAADGPRLVREFLFLAACYDRPAMTEADLARTGAGPRSLSFLHDVDTGRPRLTAPGFAAAAGWLAKAAKYRGPAGDPAAALNGTAAVAVLSLAEVGRLPKDGDAVSAKFGVRPLPGTRAHLHPATGAPLEPPDRATGVNFVPCFGTAGWVGVVTTGCPHPEAGWELLADLASAARSSELLSDPGLGFGAVRAEHLDPSREAVWGRYGFDADRTRALADAQRRYAAVSVANPAFAPRGPDHAELTALLEKELTRAAAGQVPPAEAMAAAQMAWQEWDTKRPQAAEWRRKAAGLN